LSFDGRLGFNGEKALALFDAKGGQEKNTFKMNALALVRTRGSKELR